MLSILTVQDAETLRNSLNEWVVQEKGSSEDSSWVQFPKEQPEPLKTYMVEIRRVVGPSMPIYRGIGFLGDNGKFRITGVPKEAIERWDDTYDSVYFKEWQ